MNVIKKRKRAVSRRRRLMGMVMLAVPLAFSVLTACSNQSGALDLTDTKKGKDFLFLEYFLELLMIHGKTTGVVDENAETQVF